MKNYEPRALREAQLKRYLDEIYETTPDMNANIRWLITSEHNRISEFITDAFLNVEEE